MGYTTLEGTGPNKLGTTEAGCAHLGMNSMGKNASTSPPTNTVSKNDPGLLGAQWKSPAAPAGLESAINTSNDVSMMEVPGGTLENGNDMGANWK